MARKSAAGTGTIRKKTVTRNGKEYQFWEARYTAGYDPGTGKQIQRSITGKTQKEVAQKLKAATTAIDEGTYTAPSKLIVGQWLDIWSAEYLGGVKPSTVHSYTTTIRNHLKPNLGAIHLDAIAPHQIQSFYNQLTQKGISAKTVKNIHGILHRALQQAVLNGYIRSNPCAACILPRSTRKEIHPLNEDQIVDFLKAIRGHRFEDLFFTTVFTGMREGEICGLQWDRVNLETGVARIDKQLQYIRKSKGRYMMVPTKNDKGRDITLAPTVIAVLRRVRYTQLENRLRYGECYENSGFVFTDELGHHLSPQNVYRAYKKVVAEIGRPDARFHDLRHTYAVAAIKSGDDIKTVQENLGHATAAFTLDIYGHVTDKMKQDSANRMEQFIRSVSS